MKHRCSEQRAWRRTRARDPFCTLTPWDKVRLCHSRGSSLALKAATISIKPSNQLHRKASRACTIDCTKSRACPELLASKSHPSVEQQPLCDQLVLKIHKTFLGILPLVQAGAAQAPAIPPAWAKLNTMIQAKGSGETERREEFGRKEMARSAAVNSSSLCPALGNNVC